MLLPDAAGMEELGLLGTGAPGLQENPEIYFFFFMGTRSPGVRSGCDVGATPPGPLWHAGGTRELCAGTCCTAWGGKEVYGQDPKGTGLCLSISLWLHGGFTGAPCCALGQEPVRPLGYPILVMEEAIFLLSI